MVVSNLVGGMAVFLLVVCCAGGGLCDGQIPRPGEFYRMCVCI